MYFNHAVEPRRHCTIHFLCAFPPGWRIDFFLNQLQQTHTKKSKLEVKKCSWQCFCLQISVETHELSQYYCQYFSSKAVLVFASRSHGVIVAGSIHKTYSALSFSLTSDYFYSQRCSSVPGNPMAKSHDRRRAEADPYECPSLQTPIKTFTQCN